MLRALVVLLLLANAGFWAWRGGWLAPLHGVIGAQPQGEREPERLARQVRPEVVRVLPPTGHGSAPAQPPAPDDAASAPAESAPSACLEAGPFTPTELAAAQAALQAALPDGWVVRDLAPSGHWWVAMGPYGERALLTRKREELQRLALVPEQAASAPGGAPMLVLARHDSRVEAERALSALVERGVQTARVVEAAATPRRALRVVQADAAQQALLAELPAAQLGGKRFSACPEG